MLYVLGARYPSNMKFLPKEKKFFDLFDAQVDKLTQAAKLLSELRENPQEKIEDIANKMKTLEQEADNIGHEVVDSLHHSFITPIEREDIDVLRQNLDDIMDGIERAVNRMAIYRVSFFTYPNEIMHYLEIIEKAIAEIKEGVSEMRNLKKYSQSLKDRCQRINKLENEGDEINRQVLAKLMNPRETSPSKNLEIIKRKEIYETLEDTIDCCEDVGNILESVLIGNM